MSLTESIAQATAIIRQAIGNQRIVRIIGKSGRRFGGTTISVQTADGKVYTAKVKR